MKQTLEEYAVQEYPSYIMERNAFIAGAQWQQEQQWVSVEDALPECNEEGFSIDCFLCYTQDPEYFIQCFYNYKEQKWTSAWPWSDNREIHVTHYMPLPQPPRT